MKALDSLFSIACVDIARTLMPQGWLACSESPDTLAACTAAYQRTGRVVVSDWHGPESAFANAWEQYAFAAWHDYNHVMLQASFDQIGERRVHLAQMGQLLDWFERNQSDTVTLAKFNRMAAILYSNNLGRLDYWAEYGSAPDNFRQFTMGILFQRGVL